MNRIIRSLVEARCQWHRTAGLWYAVLVCYLSALLFLSLNPWARPAAGDGLLSPDKLEHGLAYGGLAIIAFFCLGRWRGGAVRGTARAWTVAVVFSTFVGVLVEIAQSLLTHSRTGSVEDAVANAVGAGLGFVIYQSVRSIGVR